MVPPNQARRLPGCEPLARSISYAKMMLTSVRPVKKPANPARTSAAWVRGMLLEAKGSVPLATGAVCEREDASQRGTSFRVRPLSAVVESIGVVERAAA
jgi:hypothetical protein